MTAVAEQLPLIDEQLIEGSMVHRTYTLGPGDVRKCLAAGPTHVVVRWLRETQPHKVIIERDVFERDFEEIDERTPVQSDLFGQEER